MESCSTSLSSSSQQHVCWPVYSSEIRRNGLESWSMLSTVHLRRQTLDRKHGNSVVQTISRGSREAHLMAVMPIFTINATAGGSSNPLPDNAEDEPSTKDHPSRKGGLLEWFRNAVARRTAQNEQMIDTLKRYGVAGILSYGLLNTVYYLGAFLFVWLYVAPSPGGLGFVPSAERFVKIFAAVWAGSQVTKLVRAAGALSLAPFVDRGLNWYTQRFNFKSRAAAFSFLVGACFGLAALLFLVITALWS